MLTMCLIYSVMATAEGVCGMRGVVPDGWAETNHKPETSIVSCVGLCANTLASKQQTFLCDEWKIGAPSVLSGSHLCMVFKTAVSPWVQPLKYS